MALSEHVSIFAKLDAENDRDLPIDTVKRGQAATQTRRRSCAHCQGLLDISSWKRLMHSRDRHCCRRRSEGACAPEKMWRESERDLWRTWRFSALRWMRCRNRCKKIAQLTKVIYHLNTQNEDHALEMDTARAPRRRAGREARTHLERRKTALNLESRACVLRTCVRVASESYPGCVRGLVWSSPGPDAESRDRSHAPTCQKLRR